MKLWCAYSTGDEAWEFWFTSRDTAVNHLQAMLKQQHHRTDPVLLSPSEYVDSSPDYRSFWVCEPFIAYQIDSFCTIGDCTESGYLLPFMVKIEHGKGIFEDVEVNRLYTYSYTDFMVYKDGCPNENDRR